MRKEINVVACVGDVGACKQKNYVVFIVDEKRATA